MKLKPFDSHFLFSPLSHIQTHAASTKHTLKSRMRGSTQQSLCLCLHAIRTSLYAKDVGFFLVFFCSYTIAKMALFIKK